MKKLINPFKPTAGAEPPVLIGRERVIHDFEDGLEEGVGSPARLMRITGPRGSGKTVLLTELGEIARERGWTVIDETAGENLCGAMLHALGSASAPADVSADIELGIARVHAGTQGGHRAPTLREAMDAAASRHIGKNKGLLVTIDEVQDANIEDIREIAVAVQHLIREKKNVALVFAGITTGVMDIINEKSLTFLRRAKSEELGSIPTAEVARALRSTIEKSGLSIGDDALDSAAHATEGYAYLIQLVGYYVWRAAKRHADTSTEITPEDAVAGINEAMDEFSLAVHETAIADLPLRAIEYLYAMTEDEGASSTAAIAERLGAKAAALTSYRRMLIQHQVIEATARGFVAFSIPHMKEYLLKRKDDILARYGVNCRSTC